MPTTAHTPATDPQYGYIRDLLDAKHVDDGERGRIDGQLAARSMTRMQASGTIDWLKLQPAKQTADVASLEVGVYVLPDGTIVMVKESKRNPGRRYSMRWVEIRGSRVVDATGEHVKGEWQYEASLIRQVRPELQMNAEQATAFYLRFRQCARCGYKLKSARSVDRATQMIARGLPPFGPVCVRYFTGAAAAPAAAPAPVVCSRHGNELGGDGCWECNMERDERQREIDEDLAVAEYKSGRDRRLSA